MMSREEAPRYRRNTDLTQLPPGFFKFISLKPTYLADEWMPIPFKKRGRKLKCFIFQVQIAWI